MKRQWTKILRNGAIGHMKDGLETARDKEKWRELDEKSDFHDGKVIARNESRVGGAA